MADAAVAAQIQQLFASHETRGEATIEARRTETRTLEPRDAPAEVREVHASGESHARRGGEQQAPAVPAVSPARARGAAAPVRRKKARVKNSYAAQFRVAATRPAAQPVARRGRAELDEDRELQGGKEDGDEEQDRPELQTEQQQQQGATQATGGTAHHSLSSLARVTGQDDDFLYSPPRPRALLSPGGDGGMRGRARGRSRSSSTSNGAPPPAAGAAGDIAAAPTQPAPASPHVGPSSPFSSPESDDVRAREILDEIFDANAPLPPPAAALGAAHGSAAAFQPPPPKHAAAAPPAPKLGHMPPLVAPDDPEAARAWSRHVLRLRTLSPGSANLPIFAVLEPDDRPT